MFNSTLFDVVTGMVLLYLLLSLIASGVNEVIASLFRWRARDLELALKELLDKGLVTELYNHGLIQSLTVRHNLWEQILRKFSRSDSLEYRRPSYIPSHMFALALFDAIPAYIRSIPQAELAEELRGVQARISALTATGGVLDPPQLDGRASPAADASIAMLENLRSLIAEAKPFLPPDLYQSLATLTNDQSVSSFEAAIARIEGWFDEMMQRVSSLYKSKVQHFLLMIGLVVSVALNADSIIVGKVLWTNGPVREGVVAAAEAIARENVITPTDGGSGASGTVTNTTVLSGTFGTSGLTLIRQVISETKTLQLPLGWNQNPGEGASDPTGFPDDLSGWLLKLLGLLATTISISLGAPFWFDLLNKFVNVRTVLKPVSESQSRTRSGTS